MSDWNLCQHPDGCTKKTRYKTGKLCATHQKYREVSGDSHRVKAMKKPWNRCQGVAGEGCQNHTTYRGGSQCASCAQKKYWAKDKQKNRDRCNYYYLKNTEKEKARRRAYYQANRSMEILNAQLRRLNKPIKKRIKNVNQSDQGSATRGIAEGTQPTGQDAQT